MCREGAGAELAARVTSVSGIQSKTYGLLNYEAKKQRGAVYEEETLTFTVAPFCIVWGIGCCSASY